MSAGESVGVTVIEWAQRAARRHDQRDVRPDRDQLRRRQLPGGLAGEARLDRAAVSRAPRGGDRRRRAAKCRAGEVGEIAMSAATATRCSSSSTGRTRRRRKDKFVGDWGRTGDQGRMDEDGYLWYQGRSRRRDQERGLPHRPGGDRELPGQASGGGQRRGDRQARRDARRDRQGVHRAAAGTAGNAGARGGDPAARARAPRALRVSRARSSSSTRCR